MGEGGFDMDHLITVKGMGNVSVKPDLIIITMSLESHQYEYEKTMEFAADSVDALQKSLQSVGFDKRNLKTTNFNITTHYQNYKDKNNNYRSKFDGYICKQNLKLKFDFNMETMSKVLIAIAKAPVDPKLNIQFSVKDKGAVSEELLTKATENARRKAEILTKASGVTLGDLVNIDYNWGELHLYSPTRYETDNRCMLLAESSYDLDIEPDNIDVSDTVSFTWEVK